MTDVDTLVVFDIDGTLTRTMEVDGDLFARAIEEVLEVPAIAREWSTYRHVTDAGVTGELIERHLGREARPADLEAVHDRFLDMLERELDARPDRCTEVPGARAMFAALAERTHIASALATGAWGRAARLKLRVAGFRVEHLPFASSDDHWAREAIMTRAIDASRARYGVGDGTRIVYVGDGVWDVEASRALDLAFIGVGSGADADRLREAGAEVVIEDFTDLDRFLELATGG